MRRPLALALLLGAGCSVPGRDNPVDPAIAPSFSFSVRLGADGPTVLAGERGDPLFFHVDGSDPQGDPFFVTVTQFDPRANDELTTECPRFDDVPVAVLAIGASDGVISSGGNAAWTQHPAACFAHPASGGTAEQRLGLRAVGQDPAGHTTRTEIPSFALRNAVPDADAGPALWVDPGTTTTPDGSNSWTERVVLSGLRSVDRDGSFDSLDYAWRQVAGPITVTLGTSGTAAGSRVEVDLSSADPGSQFTFELTACDESSDCASSLVDVHLRPALWVRTGDGIALFSAEVGAAGAFLRAGALEPLASYCPDLAPAGDGVALLQLSDDPFYTPSYDDSRTFTHVRGDFSLIRSGWPGARAYLGLNGENAASGTAWVRLAAPDAFAELGPAGSVTLLALDDEASLVVPGVRVAAGRYAPGFPLWFAAFDGNTATAWLDRIEGSQQDRIDLGTDAVACLVGQSGMVSTLAGMEPTEDDSVWIVTDETALHVDAQGAVVSCSFLPGGFPTATAWAADRGELLVGYFEGPMSRVTDNGVFAGPDVSVALRGLVSDAVRGELGVASSTSFARFRSGDDVPFETASIPSGSCPQPGIYMGPGATFDFAGRAWSVQQLSPGADSLRLHRLPASLRTLLAHHLSVGPASQRAAAVDPASGELWSVAPDPEIAGRFLATAFDERGPVRTVPLPDKVDAVIFDPGTCGASSPPGCRTPGLWVSAPQLTISGDEAVLARVSLSGLVEATFGDVGDFGGVPPHAIALDPVTGASWILTSHSPPQVRRVGGGTTIGLVTSGFPPGLYEMSPVVDDDGAFWTLRSDLDKVLRVSATGVETTFPVAGEVCAGADTPGSVQFDGGADELVIGCYTVYTGGPVTTYQLASIQRITSLGTLTSTVAASALWSAPLFELFVDRVDGTVRVPDGKAASLQLVDRSFAPAGKQLIPLDAQILYPLR